MVAMCHQIGATPISAGPVGLVAIVSYCYGHGPWLSHVLLALGQE